MKKHVLVAVLLIVCCAAGLVACDNMEFDSHVIIFEVGGEKYALIEILGNQMITLPASPDKEGYSFDGWYLDKDIWEEEFTVDLFIHYTPTSDIKVYAKWTKVAVQIEEFRVDFDTGGFGNVLGYNVNAGCKLSEPELARAGYIIEGWYKDEDFTERWDFTSDTVDKNLTLFLNWQIITYNIFYNLDGGTLSDGVEYVFTVESDNYRLPTPIKTGYIFDGWFLNPKYLGAKVAEIINGSTGNKAVYAKWTPIVFSINYHLNGGENSPLNPSEFTVSSPNITLSAPAKEGYVFAGWYFDAEFSGRPIDVIDSTSAMCINLYAKWAEKVYTAVFDAKGGIPVQSYSGKLIQVSPETERNGYIFAGWYFDEYYLDNSKAEFPYSLNSDVTFYAKWLIEEYTITFYDGSAIDTQTYNVEDKVTDFPVPIMRGYEFCGWYSSPDLSGSLISEIEKGSYGNKNLYAKWEKIRYSISYLNVENAVNDNPLTYDVDTSIEFNAPSLEGYSFLCWRLTCEVGEVITAIQINSVGDLTLFAVWIKNDGTHAIVSSSGFAVTAEFSLFIKVDNSATEFDLGNAFTISDNCSQSFYSDKYLTVPLDAKPVIEEGENIFFCLIKNLYTSGYSVYEITVYKRHNYTVYFYDGEDIIKSVSLLEDSILDRREILAEEAKRGYTVEWYFDKLFENVYNFDTPISYNQKIIILYAEYLPIKYQIFYETDGGEIDADILACYTIEQSVTLAIPNKSGYIFIGWKNSDGETVASIEKGNTGDIFLTAEWKIISSIVSVEKNIENAGTVTGAGSYDYLNNVTLTAVSFLGYRFLGWYDGEKLLSDKKVYSFNMPSNSLSFAAKWQVADEMSEYVFISTTDSCTVKGVTVEKEKVCTVILPDYVTGISENAFEGCLNLKYAVLPLSVSEIGESAFKDCHSATLLCEAEVKPQNWHTEWSAGVECRWGVVPISRGGIYYAVLKDSASVVKYVGSGADVSIPETVVLNGVKYKVERIDDRAFANCQNLKTVKLPASINSIGERVFAGCVAVTSVTVAADNLKYRSDGKSICETADGILVAAFKDYVIPNDGSIKIIGEYAFEISDWLQSISIPDTVEEIRRGAFFNCKSLQSVTVSNTASTIGFAAFEGCDLLNYIELPFTGEAQNAHLNTHFGFIFGAASYDKNSEYVPLSLKTVKINGGLRILRNVFYGCSGVERIILPESINRICMSAFENCFSLKTMTVPQSINLIENKAFYNCYALEEINFSSVTDICVGAQAFDGTAWMDKQNNSAVYIGSKLYCYSGEMPKDTHVEVKPGTLYIASNAFINQVNLKSVALPEGLLSIGDYAFSSCISLETVNIPATVTEIGVFSFFGCAALTEVTIPNSIYYLAGSEFKECSSLKSITANYEAAVAIVKNCNAGNLTLTITSDIPDSAYCMSEFEFCDALQTVIIAEGVTYIGSYAFNNCGSIVNVVLPSTLMGIGDCAFALCFGLTEIYIPADVEYIGESAFLCCDSLTISCAPNSGCNSWMPGWHGDCNVIFNVYR